MHGWAHGALLAQIGSRVKYGSHSLRMGYVDRRNSLQEHHMADRTKTSCVSNSSRWGHKVGNVASLVLIDAGLQLAFRGGERIGGSDPRLAEAGLHILGSGLANRSSRCCGRRER